MKNFIYLLSFVFCITQSWAQQQRIQFKDSLSNYEKSFAAAGGSVSEDASTIGSVKNLNFSFVRLYDKSETVSTAIKFDIRGADLKIHVVPYRIVSYLDYEELPSFISSLKEMLAKNGNKPYASEQTIFFTSRGGVYAGCYMKNNKWKVAISTDPTNLDAYTFLNVQQLTDVISLFENYSFK